MRVSCCIECTGFPCGDVRHESYIIPEVDLKPEAVSLVIISEATPLDPCDYYYAGGSAVFEQTTLLAFNDAGVPVDSFQDILAMGVYLTSAVKCGKTGYTLESRTIEKCSYLLEKELALFPYTKAYLLMGDVAIKAMNSIARRSGDKRVIPAAATYKIRGGNFAFHDKKVFPSYLQAGPSFFIEKSKRKMIAEDIAQALEFVAVG